MKPIQSTLVVAAAAAVGVGLIVALAIRLSPASPVPTTEPAGAAQLAAGAQAATVEQDPTLGPPTIATSDLARRVKLGDIKSVEVMGQRAIVTVRDGQQQFTVSISPGTDLPDVLSRFGVTPDELVRVAYTVRDTPFGGDLGGVLFTVLAVVLGIAVVLYITRNSWVSSNQPTAFAKSAARFTDGTEHPGVRFADVAGVDEAVQELEEVVEFLRHPDRFSALGARIPRGVLLVGPPGTGKTLLARAVAGEAGVPFFYIAGSGFVEMFAGVGASRVRALFSQAKSKAPCIVFVDEIDAVGRHRGTNSGGSNPEREQTLNQLLVEMDGFDSTTNVIVIGATNRPDVLDPALLRPGRFDRRVALPVPDRAGRNAILEVHAGGKPFEASVNFNSLAGVTSGLSGAELANLINEAAILAVRSNKSTIGMRELEEAIDRAVGGPPRKSRAISDREKQLTAYHEAGHAVVGRFVPNHDPLHAISIISRGSMGGHTRFMPPEDRHYVTKSQFTAMLASALGGRAAELLVFGEVSTMAQDDIRKATDIARKMVTQYGMSQRPETPTIGAPSDYSDRTAQAIDAAIRQLIDAANVRAESIIAEHREVLDHLARELVQKESLDRSDVQHVFRGEGPSGRKVEQLPEFLHPRARPHDSAA